MTPDKLANSKTEHGHQCAVFCWANIVAKHGFKAATDAKCYGSQDYAAKNYGTADAVGTLNLMFAIPNGGERNPIIGGKLKAEGVKSGVSDIMLPVPLHGYHGLFIELKKPTNKGATKQQIEFLSSMVQLGYAVKLAIGWQDAVDTIQSYYDGTYSIT